MIEHLRSGTCAGPGGFLGRSCCRAGHASRKSEGVPCFGVQRAALAVLSHGVLGGVGWPTGSADLDSFVGDG
jgi:hypothetical protein